MDHPQRPGGGGGLRKRGRSPQAASAETAGELRALPLVGEAARVLELAPQARLEALLHAEQPMRLVRSLPDSELYLTVRELGPADALPLVALASAGQLQHLLDLESWRGDRFDADRAGAWVALLLEAGEPALRRWLRATDDDGLALLAQRWMRVRPIEPEGHGHEIHALGQSETGHEGGLVSPDGGYLIEPRIPEHAPAIASLCQLFFREQHERYVQLLWSAIHELPAELEERALHWRQSRLEEHGFPPWDEAILVYAPPEARRPAPVAIRPAAEPEVPLAPALLPRLAPADALARALERLPEESRQRLLQATLAVANRLLVADGADTGDPAAHRAALATAAGSISTALEARSVAEATPVGAILEATPMIELFREGHALAVALQARARALVGSGWAAAHPRALDLLEPEPGARLRGLLEPRPRHVPDDGPPRAFRSLDEIRRSRDALETAEIVGRIMVERLGLDVAKLIGDCAAAESAPPRFSSFLLTILAWHATRGELRGDPLPPAVAADFVRTVASRRTAARDAPRRAMESLTERMSRAFALSGREAELLRDFARACLELLAEECAALDPGVPLDPGRVRCLRLEMEET